MHGRRVRSAEDVEALRRLRNECREFMTGHTKLITKAQQAKWWSAEPRRAWIYLDKGEPVAFVYIRRQDGMNWITLGVTKKARGQGLGTLLYHVHAPCAAEMLVDNLASIRAAQKAGYQVVKSDDEKVVMYG